MHARTMGQSFGILFICGSTLVQAAGIPRGTREALAEWETGARQAGRCPADFAVGTRKEISRFQILPSVWHEYSSADNFHDPNAAWAVTQKILREREIEFRKATGREWDAMDLYLMWNAPGVYRRANWDRTKVSRVVRERAEHFAALFAERARIYSAKELARN
jgi:hypothetical protein